MLEVSITTLLFAFITKGKKTNIEQKGLQMLKGCCILKNAHDYIKREKVNSAIFSLITEITQEKYNSLKMNFTTSITNHFPSHLKFWRKGGKIFLLKKVFDVFFFRCSTVYISNCIMNKGNFTYTAHAHQQDDKQLQIYH